MRKFLFICFIIMSLSLVSAQSNYVKIVVYRNETNAANDEEIYNVFAENILTTILKNNQSEEFYMPEGSFKLRINDENSTAISVACSKGNNYFFKIYRDFNKPSKPIIIEAVDSIIAKSEMKSVKKITPKHVVLNTIRNRNAIGLILEVGKGFHQIDVMSTTSGTEAMLSFGGEGAVGFSYNYLISKYFGWSNELRYQFNTLTPYLSNANVTFDRGVVSATPYFIIPLTKRFDQKLKLGAGIDYHLNPILTIETEKIIDGFNDEWTYSNTFGYHFIAFFDMKIARNLRGHTGLKYSEVQYKFVKGKTYQPNTDDLKIPHGNSLSVSFGLDYCF